MKRSADVVIVGGGIVGCSCAYFLSREGAKVVIVERDGIGSGASGHGAGGFGVPLHYNEPIDHARFMKQAVNFLKWMAPRVAEEAGIDVLWREMPWLEVARTEPTLGYMKEWAPSLGHEVLGADEVRRLEPRLSPAVFGGVVVEGNGQVDSYRLTLAYARGAESNGAEVVIEEAVNLRRTGGKVTAVETAAGLIECDSVVLAMGAWMNSAGPWTEFPLPISPLKGELLLLDYPGSEYWPYWVVGYDTSPGEELSTYLHMRADGVLSAGSTTEPGLYDSNPTEEARNGIMQRAVRLMPGVAESQLSGHVAGPRPSPPDGTTVLGPIPGWEGLYAAVSAPGIMCSAFMGNMIKDLIYNNPLLFPIEPLHPSKLTEPVQERYGYRRFLPDPVI